MTLNKSGFKKDFRDPLRQYISILHEHLKSLVTNVDENSPSLCSTVSKADAESLLKAKKSLQNTYDRLKTLKQGVITFELNNKISSLNGDTYMKVDADLTSDLSKYNPLL